MSVTIEVDGNPAAWTWISSGYLHPWREAGCDIPTWDGQPAKECARQARNTVEKIAARYERYKAVWDTHSLHLPALLDLAEQFDQAPDATVKVTVE